MKVDVVQHHEEKRVQRVLTEWQSEGQRHEEQEDDEREEAKRVEEDLEQRIGSAEVDSDDGDDSASESSFPYTTD